MCYLLIIQQYPVNTTYNNLSWRRVNINLWKESIISNYSTGTLHFSGILKGFKPREPSSLRPFQFKDRATLLVSFITQSWGSTLTFIYLKLDGDHEDGVWVRSSKSFWVACKMVYCHSWVRLHMRIVKTALSFFPDIHNF